MPNISGKITTIWESLQSKPKNIYLLFFILGFLLYGNTITNRYAVDDHRMVENNPVVQQGIAGIPEILTTNFIQQGQNKAAYRAVPRISFALEHQFFGVSPGISHLLNIMFYVLTCILLYLLIRIVFKNMNPLLPLVATTLFLAHPIHTEVVSSLKSRDELFAFLFGISSALLFLNYYKKNSLKALVGGTICFQLSLASKESGQSFLAAIPLMLFFAEGFNRTKMAVVTGCLVLGTAVFWTFMATVLSEGTTLWMATGTHGFPYIEHPLLFEDDFSIRYGTAFYSLGYYIRLLLFPHPLGFFYGFDQIPLVPFNNVWCMLSILFYTGIFIYAIIKLKKRHLLSFCILYFLISIAMFSNLVFPIAGIVAERFVYPASLGFCIAAAYFLLKLPKSVFAVLLMVVFSLYGFKTITRNFDWKNHHTLAEKDVEAFTESAIAHFYYALLLKKDFEEEKGEAKRKALVSKTIHHIREVIRIYPKTEMAYRHLGDIYANELTQHDSAIVYYEKFIELYPQTKNVQLPLAQCYNQLGQTEKAVEFYNQAIEYYPKNELAYIDLSRILFFKGDTVHLKRLLQYMEIRLPQSDVPYYYYGNFELANQDTANAISFYEKALELKSENAELATYIADYHRKIGNSEKADIYRKLAEQIRSIHDQPAGRE
ncbi:MAG: hypothetical protein COA57_08205 [Flavobacteriales bacterium]|nr:tetratricopeptide repeat protein [Bacteroidales bacterium AH-315-I05]PCJ85084.1 MAG: hypothetical protein COA57_08205 [Flavobacteriales bacterium]